MRQVDLLHALEALDWLSQRRTVFTVSDLHKSLWPETCLRTVYRRLNAMECAGWCECIQEVEFGKWHVYQRGSLYLPTPPVVRASRRNAA